ncbi:uncharacterized protein [Physcomitrium patens]|uniref:MD-2-related lipid-recognition domain-containing protein n=1 Tax=Physcomitrium patens TaxID=3218 RepID=A0A2K1JJ91_PHYPA|nr:putative phosphatidylglycerol/phosphatidylinositol transfer protein DDB_G0278295 [Physcomitrium patens]PNR41612.1 hypothetical protein PHYPA_019015 [Physcomitrium patens]|eukprot:XP_024395184.1 putative phosphatidylglycerol/phosphatidylinositol transfer protein DDB_G0278295 [Physcomitrella patens]
MARCVSLLALSLLLTALSAVSVSANPKPSDWKVCDSHANYDVVVTNVTLNPDPVIRGQDVTFIVPATAKRDITKATVVVSVLFHGVTVHTERSSICSKADCPIPPGEFVLINTQILPGITPPGNYKIKLQILGEQGEQLACAFIDFSIVWNHSVTENFNPIELHKNPSKGQTPVAHK